MHNHLRHIRQRHSLTALFATFVSITLMLLLSGCPTSQEVKKEEPAATPGTAKKKPMEPEITIQVASLDLSLHTKKIERADILQFAGELKREKVDILALQGISRYPGVTTRVDIVD